MATTTPNLGLSKPESADKLLDSLAGFNGNADLLDDIIGKLSDLNTAQKNSLVAAINEALTSAGTAAGFGDPVATVDGNTGTPSVEVTASGPDTAKVFTFTFKNLKGDTGATGAQGPKGEKGDKGDTGAAGADGKSAYAYAVDGGYTGTEAEFAEKLAQEQLTGTTNDLTPKQVYDAVSAGIPVKVQYHDDNFGIFSYTNFSAAENMHAIAANTIVYYNSVYMLGVLIGSTTVNEWLFLSTALAQKTDIPSELPNPNALTIKIGSTTVTYDGSAAKTVEIADGSEVSY